MTTKLKYGITEAKNPGSALTHFIAMILAIVAAIPPFSKAGHDSGHMRVNALAIFILSMIDLYAANTVYHTLDIPPKINKLLCKVDHMMIFILIAGTYMPVRMTVLGDKTGWIILTLVRGIATVGILINALWITCLKWSSSLIYITMGWMYILAITKILSSVLRAGFVWLPAGGIIYIVSDIIYAMKLPFFGSRHRCLGPHEIFHLSVMDGSLCHYVMMHRLMA